MPVDPKYADLPMISTEDKDVYETDDLPEADQAVEKSDDSSIETIVLSHDKAKSVFKDTFIKTHDTDFSDRIKPNFNTGYTIETNEYILYPSEEQISETPLQKFQRLQNEVRELNTDIENIKKLSKLNIEHLIDSKDLLNIDKEAETLVTQLRQFQFHAIIGSSDADKLELDEDFCNVETREMFENIRKYISQHKTSDSGDKQMSWEKFYQSTIPKEMDNAKISNLDQRLLKLEAILGSEDCQNSFNFSQLSIGATTKNLVDATKTLTSRCQPLKGGPNVDKIEARLINLQSKLQQITEKHELVKEADKQNKIAELYSLVDKWKLYQHDTAFIAKRLADLQEMHTQALLFSETLGFVDKDQKEMKKEYLTYSGNLEKLQKNFVKNITAIEAKIGPIQSKVEKL